MPLKLKVLRPLFSYILYLKAQNRVTFLEEEKVSMEVELEDILKKLANANNELEAMNVKVNGLENELQQEKMKRQAKYLDGKVRRQKIGKKNLKKRSAVII